MTLSSALDSTMTRFRVRRIGAPRGLRSTLPGLGRQAAGSINGGFFSLWSPDGRELFPVAPSGAMMAVAIETEGEIVLGQPKEVLAGSIFVDVAKDGRLVVVEQIETDKAEGNVILVQNWFE